jgi:purine-binding chemotaxis protein CheW
MIYPAEHAAATSAEVQGFVTFRLAGEHLGVPVRLVQEVLTHQLLSPVPLAPVEVAGFLNLRGQIVTALDLAARLGLGASAEMRMNVVVRDGDELFSLQVDEVGDVVEVAPSALEPPPATLDARWRSVARGVIRLDAGLLVVLDLGALLRTQSAA